MKNKAILGALLTAAVSTHTYADESTNVTDVLSSVTGNVSLMLGSKSLKEDDWGLSDLDSQAEFGVSVDVGQKSWPVLISAAYLRSSADSTFVSAAGSAEITASTSELRLGAKKIWDHGTFKPYVAGGTALIGAEFEVGSTSMDDSSVGYWVAGGVNWIVADSFNIGTEISYSAANVELGDSEISAGGLHMLLVAGYNF